MKIICARLPAACTPLLSAAGDAAAHLAPPLLGECLDEHGFFGHPLASGLIPLPPRLIALQLNEFAARLARREPEAALRLIERGEQSIQPGQGSAHGLFGSARAAVAARLARRATDWVRHRGCHLSSSSNGY